MTPWKILESLLTEGRAYLGRASVRYADLVKLFEYLQGDPKGNISTWDPRDKKGKPQVPVKPKISYSGGRLPARSGGFADVDFKVIPGIKDWNRWFPDMKGAAIYATTGDLHHPERQAFIPARGAFGKKTWAVANKELGKVPRPGADIRRAPMSQDDRDQGKEPEDQVWPGEAKPGDIYDVLISAELTNVPLKAMGMTDITGIDRKDKPQVKIKRIAWVPAVGDTEERIRKLTDLMNGKEVSLPQGPQKRVEPWLTRPTPADQGYNPLAGNTPHKDKTADPRRGRKGPVGSGGDDEGDVPVAKSGLATNNAFRDFLSKHTNSYNPELGHSTKDPDDVSWEDQDDDEDRLFPGLKRR